MSTEPKCPNMRIHGLAERWAYPFRMEITDEENRRYSAELLGNGLEFDLVDEQCQPRARCREESVGGWLGWMRTPRFIIEANADRASHMTIVKSGWMSVRVTFGEWVACLPLGQRKYVNRELGLNLTVGRKELDALVINDIAANLPRDFAIALLYFLWVTFARAAQS